MLSSLLLSMPPPILQRASVSSASLCRGASRNRLGRMVLERVAPAPVFFLLLLVCLELSVLMVQFHLAFPACGLRWLTGLPCPLCGGTRCLASLAHLQLSSAFLFNPLVCVLSLAISGWFFGWVFCPFRFAACFTALVLPLRRCLAWPFLLALLICHWFFLCLALPR